MDVLVNYDNTQKPHVGLVWECLKDKKFGILIGFKSVDEGEDFGPKLFFFKKRESFSLDQFSIVLYLKSKDNNFEVSGVSCISQSQIFQESFSKEQKEKLDGNNHEDCEWMAKTHKKPFIYFHNDWVNTISIWYVKRYKTNSNGNVNLIIYVNSARKKEAEIIRYYKSYLDSIKESICLKKGFPSSVEKIRTYVNCFDMKNVINTFEVGERGWLQIRLGRDSDFFNVEKYSRVQSDDPYIRSLFNLYEERKHSMGTLFIDEDYQYENVEATTLGKKKALSQYSKKAHVAFLLTEIIEKIQQKIDEAKEIYEKILNAFYLDFIKSEIGYDVYRDFGLQLFHDDENFCCDNISQNWELKNYIGFITKFNNDIYRENKTCRIQKSY